MTQLYLTIECFPDDKSGYKREIRRMKKVVYGLCMVIKTM